MSTPRPETPVGTLHEIGSRDHSVTSEYRIYGPPGCGKTTNLTRQIHRAVGKYGESSVLVTSFSKAAAAELAGRDLSVNRNCIGTLHSHCFRALGNPEIAEAHVTEWNRTYPHLALTPARKQSSLDGEDGIDDADLARQGDALLQQVNRLRGRLTPRHLWPAVARDFEGKWRDFKRASGLLDFCDLIDHCLRDMAMAPNVPSVVFADEAQDLNPMQLKLVRKWGERANYFIIAGDDDQTIFSFAGATPDAILDPEIPGDHKIVLKQSYRIPRSVHGVANKLIRQVARRQEKIYQPTVEEGAVHRLSSGGYKSAEYYILKSALDHLGRGKRIMFLASCSYMLRPVIAVLRKNAVPFHNPYRRSNGFWNPLRLSRKGSAANRILSLLSAHPDYGGPHRPWTCGDLHLWIEWLVGNGILKPGAMAEITAHVPTLPVTIADLDRLFRPAALDSMLAAYEGDYRALLRWWRLRVAAAHHGRVQYPADIAAARGPQALTDIPRVTVGTIHSVKGGEADVVYLFPDLSRSAHAGYNRGGAERDAVIRLFYVGLTRARECVYLCQRETMMAVSI